MPGQSDTDTQASTADTVEMGRSTVPATAPPISITSEQTELAHTGDAVDTDVEEVPPNSTSPPSSPTENVNGSNSSSNESRRQKDLERFFRNREQLGFAPSSNIQTTNSRFMPTRSSSAGTKTGTGNGTTIVIQGDDAINSAITSLYQAMSSAWKDGYNASWEAEAKKAEAAKPGVLRSVLGFFLENPVGQKAATTAGSILTAVAAAGIQASARKSIANRIEGW